MAKICKNKSTAIYENAIAIFAGETATNKRNFY